VSTPIPNEITVARENYRSAVQRQGELQAALQEADARVNDTLQTLLEVIDSPLAPTEPLPPQEQ